MTHIKIMVAKKIAESEEFSGLRREYFRINAKIRIEQNILRLVAKKLQRVRDFQACAERNTTAYLSYVRIFRTSITQKSPLYAVFFIL